MYKTKCIFQLQIRRSVCELFDGYNKIYYNFDFQTKVEVSFSLGIFHYGLYGLSTFCMCLFFSIKLRQELLIIRITCMAYGCALQEESTFLSDLIKEAQLMSQWTKNRKLKSYNILRILEVCFVRISYIIVRVLYRYR